MTLSEFHAAVPTTAAGTDSTQSTNNAPAPAAQLVRINWADEMEKYDDSSSPTDFVFDRSKLPTAPKSALSTEIDLEAVPKKPPFNLYIANVSFEADEEKIKKFFKDYKVVSVRLLDDEVTKRPRGHGIVEFADRDSLIGALSKTDLVFNNRPLRIALNDKIFNNDRYGHKAGGDRGNQDGSLKSDEPDWRRKEPEPEQHSQTQQSTYHNKPYNHNNNRYGQNRDQQQHRGGYSRGGGGRGGGNNPNYRQGGGRQNYNQNKTFNEYGGGGHHRGSGEHTHTFERQGRLSDQHVAAPTPGEPSGETPTSPTTTMTERPKITIAPRSVPIEDASSAAVQSSIFGGAKPVNTAAKEREIEERLKIKAEKEAADRAVTAAAAAANESENNEKEPEDSSTVNTELDDNNKNIDQHYKQQQQQHHHQSSHHYQRSHKTSVTSDDSNRHQSSRSSQHDHEFQTVGGRRNHNKNHQNQNRLPQSSSFTSPNYNRQQHSHYENRPKVIIIDFN
jgi:translation initiation factor 4B